MNSELKQRLIDALESAIENSNELLTNVPEHPRNDYLKTMYDKEITEYQALIKELQNNI